MKKVLIKIITILTLLLVIATISNATEAVEDNENSELGKHLWGMCTRDYTEDELKMIQKVIEGARNYEKIVDVSEFNIKIDEKRLFQLITDMYNINELFYVSMLGGATSGVDDSLLSISISYSMSKEETEAYWKKINKKVDMFLKEINSYDNLTDLDKIMMATNFVSKYCNYRGDISKGVWHSIAGSLGDGYAVCDGYSKALSYLLSKIGIESENVESPRMQHEWDIVKYEGEWYTIDLTKCDNSGIYGVYEFDGFMIDDATWQSKFFQDIGTKIHECTSSKFVDNDNDWNPYNEHPLVYDGEYWCYADYRYLSNNKLKIYKVDMNVKKVVKTIELELDRKLPGEICLATDGERFYMSTLNAIYSLNFDGTDLKLIYDELGENEGFFGIDYIDGKLYVAVRTNLHDMTTANVYIRDMIIPLEEENLEYTTLPVTEAGNDEVIEFNAKSDLEGNIISDNFPVLDANYTVVVLDQKGVEKKTGMIGSKNKIQIKNEKGEVEKEYIAVVRGDTDGDGRARIIDSFDILRDTIGSSSFNAIDTLIRDYNKDGKVRILDAFDYLRDAIK